MPLSPKEIRMLVESRLYSGLNIGQYTNPQHKANEVRLAADKVVAAAYEIDSSNNYGESNLRVSLAELIAVSEHWLREL